MTEAQPRNLEEHDSGSREIPPEELRIRLSHSVDTFLLQLRMTNAYTRGLINNHLDRNYSGDPREVSFRKGNYDYKVLYYGTPESDDSQDASPKNGWQMLSISRGRIRDRNDPTPHLTELVTIKLEDKEDDERQSEALYLDLTTENEPDRNSPFVFDKIDEFLASYNSPLTEEAQVMQ